MLHICSIPALSDNYFWLLTEHPLTKHSLETDRSSESGQTAIQENTHQGTQQRAQQKIQQPSPQDAYIIDPGDGEAVLHVLQQYHLRLVGILITHRHYDHVDGIRFLIDQCATATNPIPIYGPKTPAIPQVTHPVYEGDVVSLFGRDGLTVMETPGHTEEHIVYYSNTSNDVPILFCGDTLFASGCGRLMGGSAEQLHNSLQRLAALPDNTQVHCAHEYTLSNLHFAQTVEPNNPNLDQRIAETIACRSQNKPTIPFELRQEKQNNPFLRVAEPEIQDAVKQYWKKNTALSNAETFALLRQWKDEA